MEYLITIVASSVAAALLSVLKAILDRKRAETEDKEVKDDVEKIVAKFVTAKEESRNDVLSLMIKNVAELREYYVINKQQARNSFSAALFICILGFLIFTAGVIITYTDPTEDVIQYTTIAGSIVEIIAGLFFWLYSKAIKQINLFHSSLLGTQKFLTAIQLVENITDARRDEVYVYIIKKIIDRQEDIEVDLNGHKDQGQ